MKTQSFPRALALLLFIPVLSLAGCGGTMGFPDAVTSSQIQGPPVHGSVFGGHAPIVGSHVYLLQPSASGYGTPAISLLGNNGATSAGGYALTADVNDPNVPVGSMYVTTDSTGSFSVEGGYTCTAGQPVFLYSYGGTSGGAAATTSRNVYTPTTASITQIVVSNAVTNSATGTATYAITLASAEPLTAGQSVTIAGLTGNLSILNGTQTALTSSPSPNTFSITATDVYGSYHPGNSGNTKYETVANGTYTPTSGPLGNASGGGSTGTGAFGSAGTASATVVSTVATGSPVVQLATVGLCTSSGNFFAANGSPIKFVYMNEVSTVATAYTFQPFTLASNNNAWDIGSSGTTQALLGIQNAALTAAQLYNIQGSVLSTTQDGEGHIANVATQSATGTPNAGNGAVPQNTIDSLANILAACIDSSPGTGGTLSTQCSTLFNTATANGSTVASGDTAAPDTATAAINIARYPAGNHSGTPDPTYVTDLFGIPTGTVPYAPNLAQAPNDWTIAITYTGGGIGPTAGQSPLSVAVDGSGNIYTLNSSTNKLVKFNAFGVPASSNGFGANLSIPSSVAIDNTSSFVWMANYNSNNVSRFTTAGTGEAEFPLPLAGLQSTAVDGSGNIWVTTSTLYNQAAGSLTELNGAGTIQQTLTKNITNPYGLAIDEGPSGAIWLADATQPAATGCAQTQAAGGCTAYVVGGIDSPTGVAVDSKGNAWFTNKDGSVTALNIYGAALANSPYATGSSNYSDGVAIDGGDNVWVTNSLSTTLFKLNPSGTAITPASGYQSNPQTQPDGIAIDPSGNVWYDSFSAGALYEIVGAALPVVTPLSFAEQRNALGQKP